MRFNNRYTLNSRKTCCHTVESEEAVHKTPGWAAHFLTFFTPTIDWKKKHCEKKFYKILKKSAKGKSTLTHTLCYINSGTLRFSRSSNESSHRHLLVTPLKEKVYSFFRLSHKSINRLRNVSLRDETTKISQRKDFIFVQKEGLKKFKLKYTFNT